MSQFLLLCELLVAAYLHPKHEFKKVLNIHCRLKPNFFSILPVFPCYFNLPHFCMSASPVCFSLLPVVLLHSYAISFSLVVRIFKGSSTAYPFLCLNLSFLVISYYINPLKEIRLISFWRALLTLIAYTFIWLLNLVNCLFPLSFSAVSLCHTAP